MEVTPQEKEMNDMIEDEILEYHTLALMVIDIEIENVTRRFGPNYGD